MVDTIIFVFRRDFRLYDNTSFIECVKKANENKWKILPVFIFNPAQIDRSKNAYFSDNCVQFMVQCLKDLNDQLKDEGGRLYFFHGTDDAIFDKLSKEVTIKAIASNKDLTPFALKRDEQVRYWCDKKGIEFINMEDYTMYPIDKVRTNQGKPFEIYTPFYRRAIRIPVPDPHTYPEIQPGFFKGVLQFEETDIDRYYVQNEFNELVGGRKTGLEILEKIRKGGFRNYKKQHDFPAKDGTTKMSGHLKFGTISIRETFKICKDAQGKASTMVQQLYWREFYLGLAYHYPEILRGQLGEERSTPIHGRYEKAKWNESEEDFDKWKNGMTGYPIVDAAMRCLNKTGWLHNRLRMIVAMFLVRDLDIDWRKGEQYFAQKLVDYDPANNGQGWCWVLSYRRKFNPYKQTGKYDDECEFIKQWLPEFKDIPVLDIITWWEKVGNYPDLNYPRPMIEIQGYRVKFKKYIPDYVRPKDPNYKKTPKKSKYGNNKNTEKYNKNKIKKQQQGGQEPLAPQPRYTSAPIPIPMQAQAQAQVQNATYQRAPQSDWVPRWPSMQPFQMGPTHPVSTRPPPYPMGPRPPVPTRPPSFVTGANRMPIGGGSWNNGNDAGNNMPSAPKAKQSKVAKGPVPNSRGFDARMKRGNNQNTQAQYTDASQPPPPPPPKKA